MMAILEGLNCFWDKEKLPHFKDMFEFGHIILIKHRLQPSAKQPRFMVKELRYW